MNLTFTVKHLRFSEDGHNSTNNVVFKSIHNVSERKIKCI